MSFGECVCCNDTCLIVNEITKSGSKTTATNCVKNCSKIGGIHVCCESCLETFNTGKRLKAGELVK